MILVYVPSSMEGQRSAGGNYKIAVMGFAAITPPVVTGTSFVDNPYVGGRELRSGQPNVTIGQG